MMIRGRSTTGN